MEKLALTSLLGTKYPIIMAPMFLVSNEKMVLAGTENGIAAAIPALNYRNTELFREGLNRLNILKKGPIGVNLIVNASNVYLEDQLQICVEVGVDFIITSLGSPRKVIQAAKEKGIKVFCDVTDVFFAKKVEEMGADAVIAVNNQAGGHAGNIEPIALLTQLREAVSIPVISAGGIGTHDEMKALIEAGAQGFSIGSLFIATHESEVSNEYKEACVTYSDKDIVMTSKLSGTPCTVINTQYVQQIGTKQTWLERILNKNKKLKKWVKAFVFYRGMKSLQKAAFSATYKTVWCAGPSIKHVHSIRSVKEVIEDLVKDGSN